LSISDDGTSSVKGPGNAGSAKFVRDFDIPAINFTDVATWDKFNLVE
jgi:hypothetical protein